MSEEREIENPAGREIGVDPETQRRWVALGRQVRKKLDGLEKDVLVKRFEVGRALQMETLRGAGGYGSRLLETVAAESGECVESLRLARHVARVYDDQAWSEVRRRTRRNGRLVPWSVHAEICAKCSDAEAARVWLDRAVEGDWTRDDARDALRGAADVEAEHVVALEFPTSRERVDRSGGAGGPGGSARGAEQPRGGAGPGNPFEPWIEPVQRLVDLTRTVSEAGPAPLVMILVEDLYVHLEAMLRKWGRHGS